MIHTATHAALAAATLALVTGCSAKDTDPGPGGVTVGEARTLDEAAQMLDARQMPQPAAQASAAPAPAAAASTAP